MTYSGISDVCANEGRYVTPELVESAEAVGRLLTESKGTCLAIQSCCAGS